MVILWWLEKVGCISDKNDIKFGIVKVLGQQIAGNFLPFISFFLSSSSSSSSSNRDRGSRGTALRVAVDCNLGTQSRRCRQFFALAQMGLIVDVESLYNLRQGAICCEYIHVRAWTPGEKKVGG